MTNSVAELLTDAARTHAGDTAVVDAASGQRVTWAELDAEVDRVAGGLIEEGVVAGYRVVLVLGNRIEFVTSYLGALRAQLVAVPINPRSTPNELARVVADCGARVVIADGATIAGVREAITLLEQARNGEIDGIDADMLQGVPTPRVIGVDCELLAGERDHAALAAGSDRVRALPQSQDPESLAALLYTSGTSGRPRGAMLSHRALLGNIDQIATVEPPMLTADDVVLGVLPLFHVYGLNAVLGATLRMQARLVLSDGFHPSGTLDLIEDEAISVVPVAPPVFPHWLPMDDLAERLGPVRLVLSGSAPLAGEVIEEFQQAAGVVVHQGYGLTEASPVVTSTLCTPDARPGSVGSALPGIEIRLRDEDGGAPEGADPGDIEIRGANLFSGYWPDASGGPDEDGWWGTGDVGFLDPDGALFLVDRRKDLIIVSGFNVYPSEVEEILSEVEGVRAVAVVGVPDDASGEAVVAYLVCEGDPDSVRSAVSAHAAEKLARFKHPTVVEVVDELPYTVTGKVQKGRLRAAARRFAAPLIDMPTEQR